MSINIDLHSTSIFCIGLLQISNPSVKDNHFPNFIILNKHLSLNISLEKE